MDTGEIFALTSTLLAILLSAIVRARCMRYSYTRIAARIDAQSASLRAEIQAVSSSLETKIDAVGSMLGEVERSHARFEGINETLSQILRQQSHTHEPTD